MRTPGGRARKRWARGALALAGPLWLATAAFAQELPCASDALGETSCAKDERGSAVVDGLGRVVCAPGMCVQRQDEWLCSWLPGGDAGLSPEGPVCDGGCRHPSSDECESL